MVTALHIGLVVAAVWTALWLGACVVLQFSEYGKHITWLARILLYVFPLFIVWNMFFRKDSEDEKLAKDLRNAKNV